MKSTLHATVFLSLFWVAGACSFWNPPDTQGPVVEGQTAPDFSFSQSSGKAAYLKDLRGRVVLINFWATWCPPCRDEMPSMNALRQVTDPNQLVILAFSVDPSWDPVHRFMSEHQYSLPVYADFDRRISSLYGTVKFPETYIINKKGEVAFKVIGSTDWMDPEMLAYLRQLMAQPA